MIELRATFRRPRYRPTSIAAGEGVDAEGVDASFRQVQERRSSGTAPDIEHAATDEPHRLLLVRAPVATRREVQLEPRAEVDVAVVPLDHLHGGDAFEVIQHGLAIRVPVLSKH
jgi:hypothetical protein